MEHPRTEFDEQRIALEDLRAESAYEQNAIAKAIHLNREGLDFAEHGRELEARIRFGFVAEIIEALRNGKYGEFKKLVDFLHDSST